MATTIFLVNPREGAVTPPSYLLDTYSAAAAYSLRQLKTGVTSVVRVRRSSDNRESDFTATEITDGTLTGFCGGGDGFVVEWIDQSGSGNTITQSTASNQPRLVSSGVVQLMPSSGNSRNGISWGLAGTQQLTLGSALTELNNGNDFSIFSVASGTNGSVQCIMNTRTNNSANNRVSILTGHAASGALAQIHNGTTGTNVTIGSNLSTGGYVYSHHVDGTAKSMDAYYNGNGAYTNTWTGTYSNLDLGVGLDRGFTWEIGVIAEIIIFGTDESANRTAIESDINGYYSIY